MPSDITVLIATHNRAEILRRTLDNMCSLDLTGFVARIVIIDNNSSDNTREVVELFLHKLPVKYLFEPRQGKNCALNKALNEVELGDLVVFTDDDVIPSPDWLQEIVEISNRWPDVSVFGGKIYPVWPNDPPTWLVEQPEEILTMAYAIHDCGDAEACYGSQTNLTTPFGANLWFRGRIFSEGYRFDETIGPTSDHKSRIMGSETSFLRCLSQDGYAMVYGPSAVVGHCITEQQVSREYLLRRMGTAGRKIAVLSGEFKSAGLYRKSRILWYACRCYSLIRHILRKQAAVMRRDEIVAIHEQLDSEQWIAYNIYYLKNHRELFQKASDGIQYSG